MVRALLLLSFLVCAPLAAADGIPKYVIEVRSGVGDVVVPPYTRLRVAISRTDARPFVGRVVVELGSSGGIPGRRGRRAPAVETGDISVVQDVTLAEGTTSGVITLDIPVFAILSTEVRLERQVTGDYYEVVAAVEHSPQVVFDESRKLVGFVSDARLKAAQDYMFYQAVEIPVAELPDSWKSLAGFDAIVINDDRLTRAQSMALADYMAAGGTVILSPSGAGSFNPETPAGSLLRIPATTHQTFRRLNEFGDALKGELRPTGLGSNFGDQGGMPAGSDGRRPEVSQPPLPVEVAKLTQPPDDAEIRIWPDPGRAKPVPDTFGLVSIARVGAGNLVLLHADISGAPFTDSDGAPTTACVKLLDLAMNPVSQRTGRTPMRLLSDNDVRDSVDIAGKRIPGRDALVIILLLYIAAAGVGMFIVARRIRRPELYPATLFAAAVVSVALVFGIGEIYKRSGDRVKAVRILVSDETTDRNALFTLGCAYAVNGESYDFVNSRKATFVPAKFDPAAGSLRGMPGDTLAYTTSYTAGEANTKVADLDRWQNVFFLHREPIHLEGFAVEVTSMPGALRVENRSPHELKACVFLVGLGAVTSTGARCEWHYTPRIGAAGSGDASITFSESTRLADNVQALAEHVAEDTEDIEVEVMGAMFRVNLNDKRSMAMVLKDIEDRLINAGLLPEPDEFLLMAVLPQGALSASSIGAQDVDEDDIGQVNLWMVRGGVEGR
jgi:hypothetical protein